METTKKVTTKDLVKIDSLTGNIKIKTTGGSSFSIALSADGIIIYPDSSFGSKLLIEPRAANSILLKEAFII